MHHLHCFHEDPEPGTRPLKEWPCTPDKAIELLKEWYDNGKPFFTKKELENVSNQLHRRYNTRRKSNSQKQLISVKGLTGSKISYEVVTGQLHMGAARNEDWEIQQPKITYLCYEQLISAVSSGKGLLEEAFFPLQIEHFMLVRASDTKLPISTPYIENRVAVDEFLQNTLKSWKESPEWQMLKALLKHVASHEITKIIGIASGSMEFGPDDEDCTYRSAIQHSLMIALKESIEDMNDEEIRFYAQEPRYTAVDTWALAEHGCEVLEDPKALLEIDNDCILFSCCPALPLKDITVDFARPAMLIWDRVIYEGDRGLHNPNSARVMNMVEDEYDLYLFWDLHDTVLAPFKSELVVYIRREVE
ncbi:Sensitivity To Red Light Reduced-like, SRR1 [Penicillium digitatum]|uniref:SRR1-like domain-containing protein n=3 Tax=Penicillium digitatum TaxID=36651 RepID=K9FYG9_PEND2|nr:hypothetical protein PDIP_84540 [Penicillium digitatum Pd1]EKV05092.1 hypothetical protein PDIP_84540 [Penicillium digitatum Pd1]EKV13607.1 hypothetical protein PDIG_37960 [Penicillium digitatum PHI26]KAG0161548.1 hypothetical protein PDIDSM_9082 [Penicillium digitatum]QQK40168.1 Sensitivity To Red Light Reduced-like, SRR1 [Penicillium digitatum]